MAGPARRRPPVTWTPERLSRALSAAARAAEEAALSAEDVAERLRACHALAAVAGPLRALHADAAGSLTRDDAAALVEAVRVAVAEEMSALGAPRAAFDRIAARLAGSLPIATA